MKSGKLARKGRNVRENFGSLRARRCLVSGPHRQSQRPARWSIRVNIVESGKPFSCLAHVHIFLFLCRLSLIDGIFLGENTIFLLCFLLVLLIVLYPLPIILLNLILRLSPLFQWKCVRRQLGRILYECVDPDFIRDPLFNSGNQNAS